MSAEPSTSAGGVVPDDEQAPRDAWTVTGVVISAGLIAICVAVAIAAALPANTLLQFAGRNPGQLVALGLPAMRSLFDLSGAITIGWLVGAVFLAPPRIGGRFDVGGYRCAQAASRSALVWCASALAMIPLSYANASGASLGDALSADSLTIGITYYDATAAALKAAVVIALVAVLARAVLRPASAFGVLLLSGIAMLPIAISGHASDSSNHDLASDTMILHLAGISVWVGGLVAFLGLARQRADHLALIARRYSGTALIAFILVALSGLGNAWIRLPRLSDLVTTDYGRLVVLKAALLVTLGGFGYWQRRKSVAALQNGDRKPLLSLAVYEIGVMAATIGVAVALGRTAPPPALPIAPSDLELVLGFDLPGPPTIWNLIIEWRFNLILGGAGILLAGLYWWGMNRLRSRGTAWPAGRALSWFAGCLVLVVATSSGLGRYADAEFSLHMIEHMALGMLVPILLVLGGPTTLALRALPASRGDGVPGMREAIVGLIHARPLQWLTHPLAIFPLFIGSFYVLYFTPLFDTMIASHVGHLIMNVHFLLVGYLYYWVIIGVDPAPRRLSPLAKLSLLLGALPFHAFFGLALMNTHTVLGASFYQSVSLPWVDSLLSDQHIGGAIAWGGAEIPLVLVIISLLAQWSKGDEREARRSDRKAALDDDADLTAYNAMLGRMAAHDQRESRSTDRHRPPEAPR